MIANAVAEPWTVMVHFWHADSAYATMMRSLWLPIAALLAVHFLVRRWGLRNHLGSSEAGDEIRKQRHEDKEVEEHLDEFAVDLVRHPLIQLVVH